MWLCHMYFVVFGAEGLDCVLFSVQLMVLGVAVLNTIAILVSFWRAKCISSSQKRYVCKFEVDVGVWIIT